MTRAKKAIACVAALPVFASALFLGGAHAAEPAAPAPLQLSSAVRALFRVTAPAASAGPGAGPASLAFVSPTLGFVATTGGGHEEQHLGYIPPSEPGRIERTRDGGISWQTLWAGRDVVFSQLAFADTAHGVAHGYRLRLKRAYSAPAATPLLLATNDGGDSWDRLRPPPLPDVYGEGYELQLASASVWFAAGKTLLRTRDAGRHWTRVSEPPGAALFDFVDPSLGYAAADPSSGCHRQAQLWRTTDGGASWRPVAGTCGPPFFALDFVNPRVGFTASGHSWWNLSTDQRPPPRLLIRRTLDGGASWQTRYTDRSREQGRWPDVSQLHFADARHGWAVSHVESQGFAHEALHVTTDGGRSWSARSPPALPTAFAGTDSAWAGEDAYGWLWRTNDDGRSWQPSVRPEHVHPLSLLAATSTQLLVQTLFTTAHGDGGGRSWTTAPKPSLRQLARLADEPVYLLPSSDPDGRNTLLRTSDGRPLPLPPRSSPGAVVYPGAVAFSDPEHGLITTSVGYTPPDEARRPVYATDDGGRSWHRIPFPPGVDPQAVTSIGPGVVVVPAAPRLLVTTYRGRHWGFARIPNDSYECGVSVPTRASIWIACTPIASGGPTILLVSRDRGATWTKLTSKRQLDDGVIATSPTEAWAVGKPWTASEGALWHTTDGGSSWHEIWIELHS